MKSQFTEIPEIRIDSKETSRGKFRRTVVLKGDLVYRSAEYGGEIVVEAGFVSDGASVPQVFWNRYPPFGKYLESAVVHDLFCDLGACDLSPVDFKKAARIFREAMRVQGVSRWKRSMMYLAVRCFGPRFKATTPKPPDL